MAKRMSTRAYLEDLRNRTERNITRIHALIDEGKDFTKRPAEGKWNALECLEHLNRYAAFYVPRFEEAVKRKGTKPSETYKPSWLGDYMAKAMSDDPNSKKVNTFRDKNPLGAALDDSVLDTFFDYQQGTLALLDEAENVNLYKIKIPTTMGWWFKLRLGDALKFIIYHDQRHVRQAELACGQ